MRQELINLVRQKSFKVSHDPPFTLASGKTSPYFLDLKTTLLNPKGITLVPHLIQEVCQKNSLKFDLVAGVELGGVPLATAFSYFSYDYTYNAIPTNCYSALYIRKSAKDHGTKKLIEGEYTTAQRVLLLEDVVTSGGSSIRAVKVLQEAGLTVVGVVAVVDREEGGAANFADLNIPFYSLIKFSELK